MACLRLGIPRVALLALVPVGAVLTGVGSIPLSLAMAPWVGVAAALQVERQRGFGQVVAAGAVPGAVQGLVVMMALHGDGFSRQQLVDDLLGQMEGLGLAATETGYSLRQIVDTVVRLQPGIEFVLVLFTAVLAYRLSVFVAPRLGVALPAATPVQEWRLWDQLIWVLIAGMVAVLITGDGVGGDLALNTVGAMLVLYAVQGYALARYYLRRLGAPRLMELLFFAVLALASGAAVLALAGAGLMDTWFDWRRLGHGSERTPAGG